MLVLAAMLFNFGCIMYPTKAVKRECYVGRLFDSNTKDPIVKTKIAIDIKDEKIQRKTDKNGQFKVPRKNYRYITWTLCGPIAYFPRPDSVSISTDGFYGEEIVLISDPNQLDRDTIFVERKYNNKNCVDLGDIYLEPIGNIN